MSCLQHLCSVLSRTPYIYEDCTVLTIKSECITYIQLYMYMK